MGIGRNSLDNSLRVVWGRQKPGKVAGRDRRDSETLQGVGEGWPGQSGASDKVEAPENVHQLFADQSVRPTPVAEPEPAPPQQADARQDVPSDRAPFASSPQSSQSSQPPVAERPAWADHPITRALEKLYEPGPGNPMQIIADSIRPQGLREGQAYQEWFPLYPEQPTSYQPPEAPAVPRPAEQAPAIDPHAEFWRVWSGHQDFLLKQCIRLMAGNMADAEDALSSAMLRASRKFENYSDSIVNERAWLSRLVHNVCIDHYRRQRRTEYRDPHEETGPDIVSTMFSDAQQTPEEIALEREQLRALDEELGRLSVQLRVPLMMRFVEGLSYPEIAERLNLRADTVRKRIQLARDHLKRAGIR